MREETLKKHISDLKTLKNNLIFKAGKISEFKGKLDVKLDGDAIKASYTLKISNHPKPVNNIEKAIVDKVVDDYQLNIDSEVCLITSTIELLESIGGKDYCEVDILFDLNKPPIEC